LGVMQCQKVNLDYRLVSIKPKRLKLKENCTNMQVQNQQ